ncbi:sugar ABC transporter ATP-binding protein (plasmid) [Halostagnicola larsenii XH-48]|uniref:ABC-type D-xylose/L-arabinose transporter n=1 Tax=Halostagnicola larsenii XH-48 TaxID=797299 RepID=W0JRX9_9EURY|nr:ABC transporter ATP-binding protein [Halostagnicola larsenii]AHG01339.1 sugar ABC transporter ATP-binding protein [Halostagnicola larsenii XH-48]
MGHVNLTNTTKRYEEVVAVDEMNLEIEDGEFLCLVGPSGCGKSTTLEMISGLTLPSDGTVEIAGKDVTNEPPKDRNISMVFQNIALFPHMNVRKNISFGLRLRDFEDEEIERRVKQAAKIVQLEGMLDRSPSELSGGQQQRVGIARAIVREPEVFLMDEPLANLDAKLRVHMRTEIQRLQKELDITTVYVTHDQEEAMTMADRIAIINGGNLQQCAPPLECYDRPANRFVASFIGSPSMNIYDGSVTNDTLDLTHFQISHSLDIDSGHNDVSVGVRPEDVYLVSSDDEPETPSAAFPAVVDVLEPVGDQTYAYLNPADSQADSDSVMGEDATELLVSIDPDTAISENETVEIVFDREKVHVFDGPTGDSIAHGIVKQAAAEPTPVSSEEEIQG